MLPQEEFAQKEHIPAEATCAYIEAKHTLYLEPTKAQEGQGLRKALDQVEKAKRIERPGSEPGIFGPFRGRRRLPLGPGISVSELHPCMPARGNPMFGVIASRRVRLGGQDDTEPSAEEFVKSFDKIVGEFPPDLIIAGGSLLGHPVIYDAQKKEAQYYSPFFVLGKSGAG